MADERTYKCKTSAAMARRAVTGSFYDGTVSNLVYSDEPDEVVVEVDTNGAISPVTRMQVVVIAVKPHHETSQEVAEGIWNLLGWDDIEGDDQVDPTEVDVRAKGWDCRVKFFY
jgi:hypothetical protein